MSKYKAGLHKDVSSMFNGVSLPKGDNAQQPSADPAPGHQGYSAPKPSGPESPPQKLPVSQPPVQKPSVSAPPVQKPSVSQPSTQQPLLSESSPPKSPVSGSPDQKPAVSQPPAQKSPAPSQATSAKPKTQPLSPQSQPKEAPAKQPKAYTAKKTAGQAQWQRKLEQIKNKLFTPEPGTSPTKQKAMVIAMPVLFIILIFVFIRVFSSPSRKVAGPGKTEQTNVAASSERKSEWQAPKPYPETLRDPMQFGSARGQTGAGGTSDLIVKGIVYSKDNPTPVVGDQVVHQGDKISDVVITKINENSVEFEANGKKWIQNVQR